MSGRSAVLCLAALLAGCADPDFYDEGVPVSGGPSVTEIPSLSASEARIFLSDSTLVHRDDDRRWTVYVDPLGELRGLSETTGATAGTVRARGSWQVLSDGRVCVEWERGWDGRDSGCSFVRQEGSVYAFTPVEAPNDTPLRRLREPGNPRGL